MSSAPRLSWATSITLPSRRGRSVEAVRDHGVWVALIGLIAYGATSVPNFATAGNVDNVLRQGAILGIVALGQTFTLISGGVDVSVGSLMGLVLVVVTGTMNGDGAMIAPVLVIALGLGTVIGLFNGFGIVLSRVNPLIWTLGSLTMLQGLIFVYTDRTAGAVSKEFSDFAYGYFGPAPAPFVVLLAFTALGWIVLTKTRFGRYMIAIGSDETSARRAGIPIVRVKVASYLIVSLCAALAGLVLAARLGVGYVYAGSTFTIPSFVAPIIGGAALTGGRGGAFGTLAGVYLLTAFGNILNLIGVSPYIQQVLQGIVVIAAIGLQRVGRSDG
jgi:ribose transport system permease protein